MISLIAAVGKNNEIGKKNLLLWEMPADMKHFRETTRGHTVIMGENTFRSIGKPLPNRKNIVVTRDETFKGEGVEVSNDLHKTLDSFTGSKEEIFIIGGAQIYAQAIKKADKLYITYVDGSFPDADTFFPEIIPVVWNEIAREKHKKDKENLYDYAFSIYERF